MAIKKSNLKDGLVFINDDNPGESVIVNFYTFVSLVKGIMIAYGNKSEGEAESIINNSAMLTVPPQNYLEACLLGHEEEYYWAMVISHGDRYFEKGLSYAAPDSYEEWESEYIKDNNLKTNTLIYIRGE
ncbi:hypothetical protein [Kosakonia cowanii]|uniref:hypothetical protein n=1 Tax=Kosakonia cowanii TaxID=208223 RepID=UPI000679A1BD|nr:hypothetical protein [Kosakonia cowanii]MDT3409816.1 hypothetical protein [Atlantibacter sp. SORGH_AS_0304]